VHEREVYRLLREQRDYVEAAVREFRHEAIQEQYRTGARPDVAFGLASIVDLVALNWNGLDEVVRAKTLDWAETVLRGGTPKTLSP